MNFFGVTIEISK